MKPDFEKYAKVHGGQGLDSTPPPGDVKIHNDLIIKIQTCPFH